MGEDIKPFFSDDKSSSYQQSEKFEEPDPEELEKAREIRKIFQESNPHYLKADSSPKGKDADKVIIDDIPVKELDTSISLKLSNGVQPEKGKKKRKGKRGK